MTSLCRPAVTGQFERRQSVSAAAATATAPTDTLPEELVIPDSFEGVETADLQALHDQAVEAFNAIYGDGSADLSDEDYQTLAAVTEQVERLRGELDGRAQAAEERRNGLADLAGRVNAGEPDPEPAGEPEGDPDTAEGGEGDADPAGDTGTEGENFSGRRIPLSNLARRARQNRPVARPGQRALAMRDIVSAAADLPGYANGQGMDWTEMGRAVDSRLRGFNAAQYAAAARAGRAMRQQFGVAAIRKPMPADLQVTSNDPAHVDDVLRRATDQSRLPGGSLVAAGGWCAPSETVYDLLELESDDGIISIPEFGVTRGGLNFTTGPDFSQIYAGTGWLYSEAQDQAGSYSGGTNEVQSISITGTPTGGTFTLTFDGQTTAPIPYNATAAQVLAALNQLPSVAVGALSTGGGPLPGSAVTVTFGGLMGGLNLPQITATGSFTGGTTPAIAVSTPTSGVVGTDGKPCYTVPCPPFEEVRLNVAGVCISAGLLAQRGYPEVLARTVRGALIAHEHRVAVQVVNAMVAGSTPVTYTGSKGTLAPLLSAIEQQVDHYRYIHRMPRSTTYEAIFPFWIKGAIRTDLAVRQGVDMLSVTDAQIDAWFAARGIAAQYIYNWQDITGTADQFTTWPSTVQFLLYAAGTWVKGTSDILTLDTIYDSVNLAQNDFTALFTEEGWLVAKRGFDSRVVTVPNSLPGAVGAPVSITAGQA